ncbi:hypothetical protein NQ314_009386 [Rhamnusium bicolor]|uniref:RNA helicase n=1 Tax=Rhamnusium bicolor TaxID=1586634 RepID=A0AAV8Y2D8_9CUCU|nr:hypothetical protein NQ314_009386 [Rhamnusium bicolor]
MPNEENSTSEESKADVPQTPPEVTERVGQLKIKPHCSCKQCDHWTNDVDWKNDLNFLDEPNKTKYFSCMTKLQKQAAPKLLVHCEYSPSSVRIVSEANFHPDIHRSLHQLEYRETKRIQIYTWPAILRLQHLCMINGPQTGKTMGYLPGLLTFLLERNERYSSLLQKAGGPIFIILCANSKKCEDIYDLAKILLGRHTKSKVSLITYPLTHVNTSHIDLLVTTPMVLTDLLKSNAINFKRLCHLILEDGDKILKQKSEVMNKIFGLIQCMLHNRVHSKPVQLIVCAEHWNVSIENLMKTLSNTPLICIGNYLEAALYGKMQFSMRFVNSACKEQELKILICTDFLLHSLLTVTSASLLIHYSLPASWTKFVKRFSCLLENCKSPLNSKESKIKCQSVVLCDEECEEHMLKFFSYINVTELKHQLPEKFKTFSVVRFEKLGRKKKAESEVSLCETLKTFGRCTSFQCVRRHIVDKDLDVSKYIPDSGKIKFKIIYIQDVTTYSIQLIEHVDLENKVHKLDDILDVTDDLTGILNISKKKIINPVVGHLYAYYDIDEFDGIFRRCELIELDDECIKIKLIDKGNIISTVKSRLYRLPKDFKDKNKSRKVIDAYLANCIPPYHDENFSAKSFFNLKNLLEKYDYKNVIMTADIHLQLGNALWLKNVFQEVELPDKTIPGFQLTREVLRLKLAEYNGIQLANLYKLCNDASITLPTYEQQQTKLVTEEKQIEPQWAHLNAEEVSEFNHLLYTLQKEIQNALKKPNYPKLQNVNVGTICLAKDTEGVEYSRVIVRNIENDMALCFFVDFGDEVVVNILELKHIYNRFISKLPFQAIQCRLHGIQPILGEWQSDVTDILYEYAMEPNTDIFRSLFIKSCVKEENLILPKQNRYSVLIKDGFGEKRILINNLLIDCGVAAPNSEEISEFEIPEGSFDANENELDEDIETIIDICRKTTEVEENFNSAKPEYTGEDLENGDMELFVFNPLEFFQELLNSRKKLAEASGNRELPKIIAAPPVDYHTPEVLWSQTEKFIKMDIKLPDVVKYNLNLTRGRILNFKTVKNEKTYSLKLMLYEQVEYIQHTSMGPQIRVTLTKAKNIDWPRLMLSKQRARNIRYDVATIDVKEVTRKILEFPKMSDDEKESDNESIDGIMYHVYSDMDSDMDVEMQHESD